MNNNIEKLYEKYPLMKYRRLEYYTENKQNIEEEKKGIYDNYDEMGYNTITKLINIIKKDNTKSNVEPRATLICFKEKYKANKARKSYNNHKK